MNPWVSPQTPQNEIRRIALLRIGPRQRAQMTWSSQSRSMVSVGSSDPTAPPDSRRVRVGAGLTGGEEWEKGTEWVGPACAGPDSAGWR